jgi:hypothetical protein
LTESAHDVSPPRFPGGDAQAWDYLRDCYHGGWSAPARSGCSRTRPCHECGGCLRRQITKYNPIAFGVTYLPYLLRRLKDEHGRPVWSFSELHLDMADIALHWAVPGPHRDILIGPRDSAKSISWIIAAVWALAHGHRNFLLAFSYTRDQVIMQLADVREALESPLILEDFPELRPRVGRGSRNTMHYVTVSGASIMGASMRGSVLGTRAPGAVRPDLIVFDDAEPDDLAHTAQEKIRILGKISGTVLPMNLDAVVLIVGTTTMPGSITHDGVCVAQGRPGALPDRGAWVSRQRFRPHYWPAILDEGKPTMRSLWPEKWSLRRLLRMQSDDPWSFDLNYRCDPTAAAGSRLWVPERYRYAADLPMGERVLSIDGAVTRKASSDLTAVVVGGQPRSDPRKVILEHAEQGRITGRELRERIHAYAALYPTSLTTVLVEINQGGALWEEVLEPWPDQIVRVIPYTVSGGKRQRIEAFARWYDRGAILHATRLPELEDQECSWTAAATTDDLLDAGSALARYLLTGWPGDGPALTVAGGQLRRGVGPPTPTLRRQGRR